MTATPKRDRISLPVLIAAWVAPALVLGGFALISGIPVAVVLVGALRDRLSSARRWWTGALIAAYAIPLAFWLFGPSTVPSLTKSMSPAVTGLVIATGVAVAIAHHVLRGRTGTPAREPAA